MIFKIWDKQTIRQTDGHIHSGVYKGVYPTPGKKTNNLFTVIFYEGFPNDPIYPPYQKGF